MQFSNFLFLFLVLFISRFSFTNSQWLGYGATCRHDFDFCNKAKFFVCGVTTNTCECLNPPNTFYDINTDMCRLLSGVPCNREPQGQKQPCIEDAYCPENEAPRCTCRRGYDANLDGRCLIPYGNECYDGLNPINKCDTKGFLQCTRFNSSYYCMCQEIDDAYFDGRHKTCYLLANSVCSFTAEKTPCGPNSYCNANSRTCICDSPLIPVADSRRCFLPHSQVCDPTNDLCNYLGYQSCDMDTRKCICEPRGEAIPDTNQVCRLLEGAGCFWGEGSQRCIRDAACEPGGEAEPGRCRCQFNLSPNKERECHLRFKERCDRINDYCDPAGFLDCGTNNTCQCRKPVDAIYDEGAIECRLKVNSPCRLDEGERCVQNAICADRFCRCAEFHEIDQNGKCQKGYGTPCSLTNTCNADNYLVCNNFTATCECFPGFVPDSLYADGITCLPEYNQMCPFGDNQLPCSEEAQLACYGGRCNCKVPGDQIYLPDMETCVTVAGAKCIPPFPNGTNTCVPNSTCLVTSGMLPGVCTCDLGFRQIIDGTCRSLGERLSFFGGISVVALVLITKINAFY